MIELIRTWLVGVTCAAMIVALAESLSPSGTVKKIGRLTGGLVLLLAILQPMWQIDPQDLAGILTEYRVEAMASGTVLDTRNTELMKTLIEEQTAAYILDKAAAMGIECHVMVTTVTGEGAYPIPDTVTVTGDLTEDQRHALIRQIEADLAIPAERQRYEREEVE